MKYDLILAKFFNEITRLKLIAIDSKKLYILYISIVTICSSI